MKKIGKVFLSLFGIVYLGVIVFATICLLFYNQYKVTQINDKTFILIDSKSDKYTDGDLVIFTKNPNSEIKNGDEIFFYEVSQGKVSVNTGVVSNSELINEDETTFTINGNHKISSESVIGKTLTAKVYPKVGKILYVIESRFGFLLFVILPALLFFFYEIYRLVMEIKNPIEDDGEDDGLKEVNVSKIEDKTSDDSFENNRGFKEGDLGFPELDNIPEPAPIKKISNGDTIFSDENLEDQKESEGSDDVESLF